MLELREAALPESSFISPPRVLEERGAGHEQFYGCLSML
jgi:hypothetical protein